MNNLSSYRGLVGAKIRASDKDLPVNDPNNERETYPEIRWCHYDDSN